MEEHSIFDVFAIVELFGHARIAGRVTEQVVAGAGLLRVDVPELPATKYDAARPGFTRFVGPSAIYSITPVSEEIAIRAAQSMRVAPVNVYLALPHQLEPSVAWGKSDEEDDEDDLDEVEADEMPF